MVNVDITSKKAAISTRIVSGTIGAIITSLVVTPFEVVKVRTQVAPNSASSKNMSSPPKRSVVPCPKGCGTFVLYNGHMDCVLAKSSVPYFDKITGKLLKGGVVASEPITELGTLAMLRRIYAREGFHGIYAGLRPTLIMAAPNTIFYYTAYEEIVWRMRQSLHRRHNSNHHPDRWLVSFLLQHEAWLFPFVAGGAARLCSSTLTAPLEFLRTRQASAIGNAGLRDRHAAGVSTQRNGGLYHEFRTIVRNEGGISTLYRGLRPTLWRDVPFSAIYWLLLEQFRLRWERVRPESKRMSALEQAGETFVSGAAAGLIAAACTTPFDVAKTRQQAWVLSGHLHHCPTAPLAVPSLLTCKHDGACVAEYRSQAPPTMPVSSSHGTFQELRRIAQTEGVSGLWRGNQARMLKVAPSCAIMLSSYELGKRLLE